MTEEDVKKYIKENLKISVYLNAGQGVCPDNQSISINVQLLLDDEVIDECDDNVSY